MVAFKLQRLSGGGSAVKKDHRLKGDPRLLGQLSFPDGNYLVATPQGYDSIKLSFLVPSVFLGYTRLAVVRSNYGFPVNKHDGVTVFEYPNTATPVTQMFVDTNFGLGLMQGQWYYYTLFAKMPNSIPNWNQVDVTLAVVTQNFGGADSLWSKIPGFYRQEDANTLQRELTYTVGGQLRRFIDLLGYEIDVIRTEIETLLLVNDPSYMMSELMYLQGYDLSIAVEKSVGDARLRSMIQDAVLMRELKGTQLGLSTYITDLTDYQVRFLPTRNFMRDKGQSRFGGGTEGTVTPSWQSYLAGIAITTNTGPSGGGASWTPLLSNGYDSIYGHYYIQLVAFSGTPTIQLRLWGTTAAYGANQLNTSPPADVFANAILVPQTGVTYTLSWIGTMYLGSPVTQTITASNIVFYWFDQYGAFISSDTHACTVGLANTVSHAHGNQAIESVVSNAAPANAVYVGFAFVISLSTSSPGSNNTQFWISGFKFEKTSAASSQYIEAHVPELQVIAQRVNLIQNPSAEVDNTLWTGTNMTSLVSAVDASATAGNKVFKITCSASANPTMTTGPAFMPINPAYIQSARFDALVPNASIGASCIITWYDGAATPNLIRTDTLNFPAPLPVNLMRTFVFGNLVPPAGAVNAKMAIQFTGTANGNVILVDSVLFGPGPPMFYFDGDTQDGLDTPGSVTPTQFSDFQWGGTQGKSTSYYYNNFYIAMKRLNADAGNWVPSTLASPVFTTLVAP